MKHGPNDPRRNVEELLEEHLPALRSFVRLRFGRELRALESSSDLVQSVCREILQHRGRFEHGNEDGFRRWLYISVFRKISNRAAYYHARQRDVRQQEPLEPGSDAGILASYCSFCTPSRLLSAREEVERIEGAFDRIPEADRELITLARLARLTHAEIGEQLGISTGAVQMRLYRALERLSAQLSKSS